MPAKTTLWYSSLFYGIWQEPDPELAKVTLMHIFSFLFLFEFHYSQASFMKKAMSQESNKTECKKDNVHNFVLIKCYLVKSSTCPCNTLLVLSIHSVHTEPEVPTLVHAHALSAPVTSHCVINPWEKNCLLFQQETWVLRKQGHITL